MTDRPGLIDIPDLPDSWRAIIRLLLREGGLTAAGIMGAFAETDARLTAAELEAALGDLCRQGYLYRESTADGQVYRANVARRSRRAVSDDVWNRLCGVDPDASPREPKPRSGRGSLWDDVT